MAWDLFGPIGRSLSSFFGWSDANTGEYHQINSDGTSENLPNYSNRRPLNVPVVWGAIRVLSNTVSGLPFYLYQQPGTNPEIKERVIADSLENSQYLTFIDRPNSLVSRLNFFKSVVVNLALHGNAFAIIHRNREGQVFAVSPLMPSNVSLEDPNFTGGQILYRVQLSDGEATLVSPENMLHFKIFSPDGIWGLSPVCEQAATLGLAHIARDWAAQHMNKGGFPGAYIIFKEFLKEEQQRQVHQKLQDIRQNGIASVGKAAILQGGPDVVQMGMSPRDTQFLENRSYTDEELAGIWGVPLSIINRKGAGNFKEDVKSLMLFGVKPYLDSIKDEYKQKLFFRTNKSVDFVIDDLIFADPEARAAYYNLALGGSHGSGWKSQNEVRGHEKLSQRPEAIYNEITHWDMNNGTQGRASGEEIQSTA